MEANFVRTRLCFDSRDYYARVQKAQRFSNGFCHNFTESITVLEVTVLDYDARICFALSTRIDI